MERRKISELVARYRLHPTLNEIYVEGTFDKQLLEWFLRESGHDDVTIYVVDTVDVSPLSEESHGDGGARGRVLSLIRTLEKELPDDSWCARGLIDGDLDFALGISRTERLLLVTDYSSMEMYAFSANCLAKFLLLGLGVSGNAEDLLDAYRDILQELFLIRLASRTLGLFLSWVDFTDSCASQGDVLSFDREDFLRRLLSKNGAGLQKEEIENAVAQHRTRLTGVDPRRVIHGHDFTSLVAIHWRTAGRKRGFRDLNSLPRLLIMGLDRGSLSVEPLFSRLLGWLEARAAESQ